MFAFDIFEKMTFFVSNSVLRSSFIEATFTVCKDYNYPIIPEKVASHCIGEENLGRKDAFL